MGREREGEKETKGKSTDGRTMQIQTMPNKPGYRWWCFCVEDDDDVVASADAAAAD